MKRQLRSIRNGIQDVALRVLRKKHVQILGVKLHLWGEGISSQMRHVLLNGYEESDAILAGEYLSSSDKIIECGSSIGFMSLYARMSVGVKDYVMVEASHVAIELAKKNYELNRLEFGPCKNVAVSGERGEVAFNLSGNFWSSSTLKRSETTITVVVPGVPLPDLIKDMGFKPNVLIMDIEGGEVSIPVEHFLLFEKIIIEVHPTLVGQASIDAMLRELKDKGFSHVNQRGATAVFVRQC